MLACLELDPTARPTAQRVLQQLMAMTQARGDSGSTASPYGSAGLAVP